MQWLTRIFIAFTVSIFVSAVPTPDNNQSNNLVEVLFPHYLVPAKQASPNAVYGTQYTGDVKYVSANSNNEIVLYASMIKVGFDVPNNGASTCSIKFQLPVKKNDPNGYPWTVTGSGKLNVYRLKNNINQNTLSWNNRPQRSSQTPAFQITQPLGGGIASVVGASIPCSPGRMDFEFSATRPAATTFNWYELDDPVSGATLETYS